MLLFSAKFRLAELIVHLGCRDRGFRCRDPHLIQSAYEVTGRKDAKVTVI